MEKELKDELKDIEKYCLDQNILIYPTSALDIELLDGNSIDYKGDDWKQFIDIARALEAKVIVVSSEANNVDQQDEDDVNTYKKTLDPDDLKEYNRAYKIVESRRGELLHFQLNFFVGGINYALGKQASWFESYDIVMRAFDLDDDDDDDQDRPLQLSDEEIEQTARQIAEHAKYRQAKDRFERERIGRNFAVIEILKDYSNRYRVLSKAEQIFEEEIQPGIDQELAEKIQEMKKKGLKKIAVKSQLRISDTVLNRFWYN